MLNLLALQHADSAFPSGSFAFSGGIEGLVALNAPLDAERLEGILIAVLHHRWAGCERVSVVQAWRAGAEPRRLGHIDRMLEAATLPATLRNGSRRNGAALLSTHKRLGTAGAAALQSAVADGVMLGHLASVQGSLWRSLGIGEAAAVLMSGYATVAALASAAVRLNCLGALSAQAAVGGVLPLIATYGSSDDITEETPLAGALPWLDMACARQEAAATRLFSN